jgi:hypothetical protein
VIALVCPECGEDEFYQDRPEVNRYTMTATGIGDGRYVVLDDTGEVECQDSERDEVIFCSGCRWELDEDELVPAEEYNAEED